MREDSLAPFVANELAFTASPPLTLPPSMVETVSTTAEKHVEEPYAPPWSPSPTLVTGLNTVRVVRTIPPTDVGKSAFKASLFDFPGRPSLKKSLTFVRAGAPSPLLHRRARPRRSKFPLPMATFSGLVADDVAGVMASDARAMPVPVGAMFA